MKNTFQSSTEINYFRDTNQIRKINKLIQLRELTERITIYYKAHGIILKDGMSAFRITLFAT